jgi:3-isopropylmalate/(R)-2-methylmalate dehydratase small subunit
VRLETGRGGIRRFTLLRAVAAPWLKPNVDTDVIIRVERCARVPKEDLGRYAFEVMRFAADGAENPNFPLNREPWRRAGILVAGENFGCGSSREMAVWALAGMGIRCVIAPSFGEIFFNNCFENGLLPVRLPQATVERLAALLLDDPERAELTVDLARQRIVTPAGEEIGFEVDPLRRKSLLEGLDAIGVTLSRAAEIDAWQRADRERRPWIYV